MRGRDVSPLPPERGRTPAWEGLQRMFLMFASRIRLIAQIYASCKIPVNLVILLQVINILKSNWQPKGRHSWCELPLVVTSDCLGNHHLIVEECSSQPPCICKFYKNRKKSECIKFFAFFVLANFCKLPFKIIFSLIKSINYIY